MEAIDPFVFRLSIFVLAIFVGYFVVWSVTPALHTPLMSVTNAISSVIVVGALIAVSVSTHPAPANIVIAVDRNENIYVNGAQVATPTNEAAMKSVVGSAVDNSLGNTQAIVRDAWTSKGLGFVALILACVNIFGGFLVTSRMLAMYKKKEKK
jgi:H+-translocating NAD(P) transhydrogenase subunit alpha